MSKRYDPSPPQGQLDLGPFALDAPLLKSACTSPTTRLGQDQYRCNACGVVWDVDEERPPCNLPQP